MNPVCVFSFSPYMVVFLKVKEIFVLHFFYTAVSETICVYTNEKLEQNINSKENINQRLKYESSE